MSYNTNIIKAHYASKSDITFITRTLERNNVCISVEVIGFYWGPPSEELTKKYINRIKAFCCE